MRLAIFDLDGTVLRCNSWHVFFRWTLGRRPVMAPLLVARLAARRLRLTSARSLREATLRSLKGMDRAAVRSTGNEIAAAQLLAAVRPEARRQIARSLVNGLVPVMATGAFDFLARPVAAALSVDELVCSHVAFGHDKCLGRIEGNETRGAAKAAAVQAHFARRRVDWAGSYAYSDDAEDAPLWSLVGHPVMVAPGRIPAGVRHELWESR